MIDQKELRSLLEGLYRGYNTRQYARRDPVWFVHRCDDPQDAEVTAFIAAMLAYGNLKQIMASVADALRRLGPRLHEFLTGATPPGLAKAAGGFSHRFVNDRQFGLLLRRLKAVLEEYGSLQACFARHDRPEEVTVLPGLRGLAAGLRGGGQGLEHLVADPRKSSACKRWHLFMRWMVRRDEVDPGPWEHVSRARLVVPLDTHMWRVCRGLGFTARKTASLKAALEVTDGFRKLAPADPVKYDFALMHASADEAPALRRWLACA